MAIRNDTQRQQITELLNKNERATTIVEIVGCSLPFVYKVAHEIKHQFPPKQGAPSTSMTVETVAEHIANDETLTEIAKAFDRSKTAVAEYIERHGLGKPIQKPPANKGNDEYARQYIEQNLPQYEYVDGYTCYEGRARIKCKQCGNILDRSWITIRNRQFSCEVCRAKEQEPLIAERKKREAERAAEREARNAIKEAERIERQKQKEVEQEQKRQERFHPCPVCGTITGRRKYCSDECCRKATNHSSEIKRRTKIEAAMVDKDITVQGLYKRDGGICYLCGKPCRLDDYITKGGTIIAGEWYPSIDHVVPLARGGKHSWENVRLAHRRCNCLKRDNEYVSPRLAQK